MSLVLEKIQRIISELTDLDISTLSPEKFFIKDLDLDSLDIVEIVMGVEDEFNLHEKLEELTFVNGTIAGLVLATEQAL